MERLTGIWIPPTETAISGLESEAAQELFNGLFQRPEFEFGLLKLREFLQPFPETRSFLSPETRAEFDYLRGRLAGLFFECIAHDFLAGKIDKNQRLISSWQTDAVYRWRFRRMKDQFDEHDGFGLGISGITVPDGILFDVARDSSGDEELAINSVCEYGLSIRAARKRSQAGHYRSLNVIGNLFPLLPDSLIQQLMLDKKLSIATGIPQKIRFIPVGYKGVIYVLPKPNDEQEEEFITRNLMGNEVVFVPFTSLEFGKVLTAIIDDVVRGV